ncbi:TolC family protein [Denitratisoma oestradiolicum]|uniref:Transporter n=1 Tax=Denitratisoma oestradiolicum TaxID=311182 RepID=A0A6S6XVK9_9PROT|nr:TolC family protein [Denitratisoma oestradiolicum]TWO81961.1 transporter [Denitratisoma oestradiolicum]CAB1368865.1 Transporter [Denitratisoma oestradiolicum]
MRGVVSVRVVALLLVIALVLPVSARETVIGNSVDSLLDVAKGANPEYIRMRLEADAAAERVTPAGALPDPKFRLELRDITRMGEQDATLAPNRVGSTRYLLMQDLPWFGKRDLKREVAGFEAEGARGRALDTWAELATRIKIGYAQLYYLHHNESLTREILDLMVRLEKVAQVRYASGLAAQQDVIRAQIEQTNLRTELLALETEQHHLYTRLNALLARPAQAPLAEPEQLRPLPAPARLDRVVLEDRLKARNPQLFTEEARLQAAEKGRELTYRNRYPDFTVGVSPIQYRNAVKEWELMVELNIPLQQSSRRAQERESDAMVASARARKESETLRLLSELEENLASIETARRTESLATTSLLPQAELSFRSALAGYETGKVDFATLLDAQRQIRLARQTQVKAQVEAQMRLAEIERLLGEDL